MINPTCPYCSRRAVIVGGDLLYRGRTDLAHLNFWVCAPCQASVGCHKAGTWIEGADGRRIYSHGAHPLGTLANANLRALRSAAHTAIDWRWRGAADPRAARKLIYQWLARQMHLPVHDCHIGGFNEAQCLRAIRIGSHSAEPI
ncbi:MAG: Erwinia phage Ea9-2 [Pseudomonadota bacterium]|jgi:hypothetical protein